MADITKEQVVEYLSNLPVIEVANLVKELEDKWGVSAAPVIQGGPVVQTDEPKEEQTEFDVELTEVGDKKMEVIKAVRKLTSLGLKEAKDTTEAAPKILLEAVGKDVAEDAKKQLEEAGAKVTLK